MYFLSDPTGARTQDPNIKSVVLYQLSYRVIAIFTTYIAGANIELFFLKTTLFLIKFVCLRGV